MKWWPFLAGVLLAALLAVAADQASAQALATPAPPPASLRQQPGAPLPLEMKLVDDLGQPVRLGDYFQNGRPVLLVLGYYRCPQLCGLLMHGLLEALQRSAVPRRDWRIVGVSIDPGDTPATARARRNLDLAYADFLLGAQAADAPLDLHLLTASAADERRLARLAGFFDTAADPDDRAARAAGPRYDQTPPPIVATEAGQGSPNQMGHQIDADELKIALADAAGDRIASVTSRIALLCAHFNPHVGRHSATVMNGLRVLGVLLALMLGAWCWRRRGQGHGAPG
jgi:protein SCO1/2